LRAQRVDEWLPDPADTGWLPSAASEYRLDVRARLRRRDCHGGAQQPTRDYQRGKKDTTDLA
jgi:hypothetical protein